MVKMLGDELRAFFLIAAIDAMSSEQSEEYLRRAGIDPRQHVASTLAKLAPALSISPSAEPSYRSQSGNPNERMGRIFQMADFTSSRTLTRTARVLVVSNSQDIEQDAKVEAQKEEIRAAVQNAIQILKTQKNMLLPVPTLAKRIGKTSHFVRSSLVLHAGDVDPLYGLSIVNDGGAIMAVRRSHAERPFANKKGRAAISTYCGKVLIEEGDIVIFDGGDQTRGIAEVMFKEVLDGRLNNITVITNNYHILSQATDERLAQRGVNVFAVGGQVRTSTASAHGEYTRAEFARLIRIARELNPEAPVKAFLGATQICTEGCAVLEPIESPTKEVIIRLTLAAGGIVYIAADSSKQTLESKPFVFLPFEGNDSNAVIVTDARPSEMFCETAKLTLNEQPLANSTNIVLYVPREAKGE